MGPGVRRDDDGKLARRIGACRLHRTLEAVPIGFARVGSLVCRPEKGVPPAKWGEQTGETAEPP